MAEMSSPEVFSDRYELVRHIARGGMAQVYLAQDLLLDRPVAIKVLFPELSADPSFVERFRREAQAAANLSHPNIVSIYDWGQGEHTYFIVMEYVDGQTLSSLVRQGPLPPARAAAIAGDIAAALDFAHRRGVIHRDVKPGNVLIDRAGHVKVADFGIARAVSQASEGLTQTGAVMGTATYFSPEQAQGQPVDARSDVYSLGVVLYEMLTGKPPFTGDSPVAIAYKHVREVPSLPSSVNAAVPAELEAVAMAAMAKDPEDRYQSARDLRDDLLRFQRGQPVLAPHPAGGGATRAVAGPPSYPYDETYAEHRTSVLQQTEPGYASGYPTGAVFERSRAKWWAALFVVLLAVLGVLVFFIGRNQGWWEPSQLSIPPVKGDSVAQAESKLAAAGFHDVKRQYLTSSLVQKGEVIGTVPHAGASASPKDPVILDVSSGAPMGTVPNVVNGSCGSGAATLLSKGFHPKNVPEYSNTAQAGMVISTSPSGGQREPQGTEVTVYCSLGKRKTIVPNLQGLTLVEAGAKLQSAHLTPGSVTTVASPTIKPGYIVYTSPGQGSPEPWYTVVNLYVSGGPEMTTVPPDLLGETAQQAEKEVGAAKLRYVIQLQTVANQADNGRVVNAHPRPDASVRQGSTVTLYVGEYLAPPTTATTTTTAPAASSTTAPAASSTTSPSATTVPQPTPPGKGHKPH